MINLENLEKLKFKKGKLKIVSQDDVNDDKIIFIKIPRYLDAYLYAHQNNLNTFYFGDRNDIEFFTINIRSLKQIEDLLFSLNYTNYV